MIVLDASAVLAQLYDETGADRVQAAYETAAISAANWAEVIGKVVDRGRAPGLVTDILTVAGITIVPVITSDAQLAGELRRYPWARSLSLGDRLCLALAVRLHATVLTADRAWADVDLGIDIELIR